MEEPIDLIAARLEQLRQWEMENSWKWVLDAMRKPVIRKWTRRGGRVRVNFNG